MGRGEGRGLFVSEDEFVDIVEIFNVNITKFDALQFQFHLLRRSIHEIGQVFNPTRRREREQGKSRTSEMK